MKMNTTRINCFGTGLAGFLGIILLLVNPLATAAEPNVLWISVDDLNNWVEYLDGHPQVKTPNINRLVDRGIAFTNAHCTTPLCNPSRTAILSGLSERTTNMHYGANKWKYDPKKHISIPQYFAENGYMTYGTGKIHHSKINDEIFMKDFSVSQRWSPFSSSDATWKKDELKTKGSDNPRHVIKNGPGGKTYVMPFNRMPSERSPKNTKGESFDWAAFDLPDMAFGDGKATAWAVQTIREHKGNKPFFLGIGYYRPHVPLYAPKKYFDLYPLESIQLPMVKENDLDDIPTAGRERVARASTAGTHKHVVAYNQWREGVQAYLACISFIDAQIGLVLDALEASPHNKNTIIVLFGDHGWHLGEKGTWGKLTAWIHATKVPMIICPVGSSTSVLCNEPVSLLDLYPTLVELAGLPVRKLDGLSLVPLLQNPTKNTQRVVRTFIDKETYALSGAEWRFIHYADGGEELYNMEKDPMEFTNLIKNPEYNRIVEELKKRVR